MVKKVTAVVAVVVVVVCVCVCFFFFFSFSSLTLVELLEGVSPAKFLLLLYLSCSFSVFKALLDDYIFHNILHNILQK